MNNPSTHLRLLQREGSTFAKLRPSRCFAKTLLTGILLIASDAGMRAMDIENLDDQLFRAAYCGDDIMVQELIAAGAQVNAGDYNKRTPLILAIRGKGEEAKKVHIVDLLIKHNADLENQPNGQLTPLLEAAESGSVAICKLLIAHKANIHKRDGHYGGTALMWAATMNHGPVCSLFIRLGVNINDTDTTQRRGTALSWAVAGFENPLKYETVKTLLELIIQLKPHEKDLIKNWLLVTKKMDFEHGIQLPAEMRLFVAEIIYRSLAQELLDRINEAGGQKALEMTQYRDVPRITALLNETGNFNNLEKYVRQQTLLRKLEQPATQSEENGVATNAFKRMKISEEENACPAEFAELESPDKRRLENE